MKERLKKCIYCYNDGTGTRQTRINAGKTAVVPGWKEQKESRQNEGIRSTRRKLCLDIKFLRENPEVVKQNIRNKFQDQKLELVDKVIELDKKTVTSNRK